MKSSYKQQKYGYDTIHLIFCRAEVKDEDVPTCIIYRPFLTAMLRYASSYRGEMKWSPFNQSGGRANCETRISGSPFTPAEEPKRTRRSGRRRRRR